MINNTAVQNVQPDKGPNEMYTKYRYDIYILYIYMYAYVFPVSFMYTVYAYVKTRVE